MPVSSATIRTPSSSARIRRSRFAVTSTACEPTSGNLDRLRVVPPSRVGITQHVCTCAHPGAEGEVAGLAVAIDAEPVVARLRQRDSDERGSVGPARAVSVDLVEVLRSALHQVGVSGDPGEAGARRGGGILDPDQEQPEALAHMRPQDVRLQSREQRNVTWAASAQCERLGQATRACATVRTSNGRARTAHRQGLTAGAASTTPTRTSYTSPRHRRVELERDRGSARPSLPERTETVSRSKNQVRSLASAAARNSAAFRVASPWQVTANGVLSSAGSGLPWTGCWVTTAKTRISSMPSPGQAVVRMLSAYCPPCEMVSTR